MPEQRTLRGHPFFKTDYKISRRSVLHFTCEMAGDYRIVYRIEAQTNLVIIVAIKHPKDVYEE